MSNLTEGWLPAGTSIRDYLDLPALGSSGLRAFRRSPAHYKHLLDNPEDETPAMRFGTAVHTAVLEPHLMGEYTVLEACHGRYKGGKKAGQRCASPAKIARRGKGWCGTHDPKKGSPATELAIHASDHARVTAICEAIRAHPEAGKLLGELPGNMERSAVFQDEDTGVWCKIRPDRMVTLHGGIRACIDLKTTSSEANGRFARDTIPRYGYHFQASLYRRGLAKLGIDCEASIIVAVESDPPHGVGCFLFSEPDLERAHGEISRLLESFAECMATDVWPGYPTGFRDAPVPDWAFR